MKVTLEYGQQTVDVAVGEIADELPRSATDTEIERYVREYIDSALESKPWPSYNVRVDDVVKAVKKRLQSPRNEPL